MVAKRLAHRMPRLLRSVLEGLGTPDARSADLMSYLLFDRAYTSTLVEIGYADAGCRMDEIESFLAEAGAFEPAARGWPGPPRARTEPPLTTHRGALRRRGAPAARPLPAGLAPAAASARTRKSRARASDPGGTEVPPWRRVARRSLSSREPRSRRC